MTTYYTSGLRIIKDRDTIAAARTLEDYYACAGGIVPYDPTPAACGGVFFEDLYRCEDSGDTYEVRHCPELIEAGRLACFGGDVYAEQPDGSYAFVCCSAYLEREGDAYVITDDARELDDDTPARLYRVCVHAPGYGIVSETPVFSCDRLEAWLDPEDLEYLTI